MYHHNVLYPKDDLVSDKYRNAGKNNSVYLFVLPSLVILAIPIYFHLWYLVIEMLLLGWMHNYFHDATHIRNHYLNRFSLFRRWKQLHFKHHLDTSKNYGIFFFLFDRIFGSFWE